MDFPQDYDISIGLQNKKKLFLRVFLREWKGNKVWDHAAKKQLNDST